MIWLKKGNQSDEIVGINMYYNVKEGIHELWATKVGGKSFRVVDSTNKTEVEKYKEMIDYAVEIGDRVVEI